MTKTKKIENWLDSLIFARKLYNSLDDFAVTKNKTLKVCGRDDYIQLYNSIDYICKVLDIPVESDDNDRKFFMYHDMRFIEV